MLQGLTEAEVESFTTHMCNEKPKQEIFLNAYALAARQQSENVITF